MSSITAQANLNHTIIEVSAYDTPDGVSPDSVNLTMLVYTTKDSYINDEADYSHSLEDIGTSEELTANPLEILPSDLDMEVDTFKDGLYKISLQFIESDEVASEYSNTFFIVYNNDIILLQDLLNIGRLIESEDTKYLQDSFELLWSITTMEHVQASNVVGLVEESLEGLDYLNKLLQNN